MKIKLTRNTIVDGQAYSEGDIVDASEKASRYLLAIGKAVKVEEVPVEDPKEAAEKTEYQELKAKAKELGIKGYAKMKKEALAEEVAKAEALAKLYEELKAMSDEELEAKAEELEIEMLPEVADDPEKIIQAILFKVSEPQD